jgi:hypothetical protein
MLALLLAAVAAAGVHWGTFVAGGSDSFCYAHQAERWAAVLRHPFRAWGEQLQVIEPLALDAPWPDAARAFAPTGHVPSPTRPGAIAPICPVGLAIVMAPFRVAGGRDAIFVVVPLFGALLVGATYVLGSRFAANTGLVAATLAACSPVFLYQLMQPMSDVPAAAMWVAAAAAATSARRRGPLVAGLAAAVAILVRPNGAPLAVPLGLFLLLRPERGWSDRARAAAWFGGSAALGALAVAVLNHVYYGSPLTSGYGDLDALFSVRHVGPNVRRYAGWLSDTQTPVWLLAAAAPVVVPGALSLLLAAMVAVNVLLYLPYAVFDDWSFLRFLLPSIPMLLVLLLAASS